jgi:hypothetical protein
MCRHSSCDRQFAQLEYSSLQHPRAVMTLVYNKSSCLAGILSHPYSYAADSKLAKIWSSCAVHNTMAYHQGSRIPVILDDIRISLAVEIIR